MVVWSDFLIGRLVALLLEEFAPAAGDVLLIDDGGDVLLIES